MAKTKTNRISINALEKALQDKEPAEHELEWNGLTITVKKRLGFEDMMRLVDNVTSLCFSADGAYLPEVRDFALCCGVIEAYTNLSLPANTEKCYELVSACRDLVTHIVLDCIDDAQFKAVRQAIDEKIHYRAQANIEALSLQMSEAISRLDEMGEKISSIFEGIEPETIKELASAMAENGFDEEKLVKTYFDVKQDYESKDGGNE